MKTPVSTEPGLLAVFRLFTGLQFVILLVSTLGFVSETEKAPHPIEAVALMTGLTGVLLAYLFWSRLERLLGRGYIP